MDSPRRRFDPLALAVHGVALAFVVAAGVYVLASLDKGREMGGSPASAPRKAVEQSRTPPPTPQPEKPVAVAKPPAQTIARPVATELIAAYGAGRAWQYRVTVEPAVWRDATLTYRMVKKGGAIGVDTEFRHSGGQMNFHLGTFVAGHPSHASMRFPGFFMHAAYLDRPLEVGQRFVWEWPWQLPGGEVRAGRVKRYVGEVKEWENIPAAPSAKAPGNFFGTARIEATLYYIEDGTVRASAAETLWFAPRFLQVVKVVREGKTPDEGVHRIVAELVEHHYP